MRGGDGDCDFLQSYAGSAYVGPMRGSDGADAPRGDAQAARREPSGNTEAHSLKMRAVHARQRSESRRA